MCEHHYILFGFGFECRCLLEYVYVFPFMCIYNKHMQTHTSISPLYPNSRHGFNFKCFSWFIHLPPSALLPNLRSVAVHIVPLLPPHFHALLQVSVSKSCTYPCCLGNTNENAELKIVAEKTVWLLFVQFIFDSDTFRMVLEHTLTHKHSKIKYSLSFHVSHFHSSPAGVLFAPFRSHFSLSLSHLGYFVN